MKGSLPTCFVRPFTVSRGVCILDALESVAVDFADDGTVRARGWARISFLPNSGRVMDAWEAYVAERCAGVTDLAEAARRLNEDKPTAQSTP
jgi:hypothetical protein